MLLVGAADVPEPTFMPLMVAFPVTASVANEPSVAVSAAISPSRITSMCPVCPAVTAPSEIATMRPVASLVSCPVVDESDSWVPRTTFVETAATFALASPPKTTSTVSPVRPSSGPRRATVPMKPGVNGEDPALTTLASGENGS